MTNIANILTMSRIAAIPLIAALLFFDQPALRWLAFALFAIACITDFFDGYIARRMAQVSALGRFLDPIADKLVVAAILMVMTAHGQIRGWVVLPALIILCREILVSGLREYLAELKVRLPVSILAKWKTTMQMVAMGFLIVGESAVPPTWPIQTIGEGLLWLAAALTLLTGYDYLRVGIKHMTEDDRADHKQ
ncbi:MAG TPA: CDP-diacylglycerol--glycerol-3-phosphate 3-phosphatidyltransferase [Dongiaceae bacterium]|jgi:cardiolipin synthase|nr:CDP-diacylglycerol--glycerol-3-phosphate 3-phosphatidyltransferase [Dongiaceae bacterium]